MQNSSSHWARTFALSTLISLCLLLNCAGCQFVQPTAAPLTCQDPIGCITIAPEEPVKIGVLQTLSGGSSPGGIEQLRSIELALYNRKNSLVGHTIQLLKEDERCSSEGGANAALRIIADPQVVGILGTNCSGAAVTASKIMSEKGLVMVSGSNTSPTLTSIAGKQSANWQPGYYRTAWNDSVMGDAAAHFAYTDLKVTHAAVINAGDAYSKGLTDVFSQAFIQIGGRITLEATIDEDDPDLFPTLQAVQLSKAQLVFFPLSHPEAGARLVNQAAEIAELDRVIFIGGEGMLSNIFLRDSGINSQGVYITGPAAPQHPDNVELRRQYLQAYGEEPASFYYSFAYDAANILLNALEKTAQQAPDGGLQIGRQALRDALYSTRNYQGLTGILNCDSFGDCGAARLNIVQVEGSTANVEELRGNVIYTYAATP